MNCDFTRTACTLRCPSTCVIDSWSDDAQQTVREMCSPPINQGPMLETPIEKGHYVYKHIASDGSVLYVGRTKNPLTRLANHVASRTSWWFDQVWSIEYTRYAFESAAAHAEQLLIAELRPPCNLHGVRKRRTVTRQTRAQVAA